MHMLSKDFIRSHACGCTVDVLVSPGSSRTAVVGVNPWRGVLEVKVAAEARQGAANQELLSFLSQTLGVPRESLRILRGERSQRKVIAVPLPEERVRSVLGGE